MNVINRVVAGLSLMATVWAEAARPNVIIILTDDQGYADVGCCGAEKIKTPQLDQMASEGIRFTDAYVASSVCSASRAALLTGRLPARNGVGGVLFPEAKGLASSEVTIAEILKAAGYRTACFGKWHLGDSPSNLPTAQGFDEYFGIPYSNDMYIAPNLKVSNACTFREGWTLKRTLADQQFVKQNKKDRSMIKKEHGLANKVSLLEGEQIIEYPADQTTLTKRYVDRTIQFIDESGDAPFFIYLTPAMPHIPLFASERFKGKSKGGLYGDTIEEIDWNVGRLLGHLKSKGLDTNTMVVFASDNGPWLGMGKNAGSAGELRDGKFSNYEGGVRVPFIVRWPGMWAQGQTSGAFVQTIDLLPTIAHYTGASLPEVQLDGRNLSALFEDPMSGIPEVHLYSAGKELGGIRFGDWKYMPFSAARNAKKDSAPELFNLKNDPSEKKNVYDQYPEVLEKLSGELEKAKSRLN